MATSFTAAALGAGRAGKDVEMIVGNGYARRPRRARAGAAARKRRAGALFDGNLTSA